MTNASLAKGGAMPNATRRTALTMTGAGLAAALAGFAAHAAEPNTAAAQKPKRKRNARATIEDFAATDFEPWSEAERVGVDRDGVKQDLAVVSMLLPFCYRLMFKTKAELMADVATWDEEKGRLIAKSFIETTEFLKVASTLIEAAEARILVAGAALEVEGV